MYHFINNNRYSLIAGFVTLAWAAFTTFVILNHQALVDKIATTIQLPLYLLLALLIFLAYKQKRLDKQEKTTHLFFFILIITAFLTNLLNYIVFNFIQADNFFLEKLLDYSFLDKSLKMFDYAELFLWYLLVACFLLVLLNRFFKKAFYLQPQFYLFATLLLISLSVLLYLGHPSSAKLTGYDLVGYISSIVTILIFVISIYGLIHSQNLSAYLLFSAMIAMMVTQITALFYYSYHLAYFMHVAYSAWLLWILLAILAYAHLLVSKKSIAHNWFVEPESLESNLAYKTLVITNLCLVAFFIFADVFNFIDQKQFVAFFLFVIIYMVFTVIASKRSALSFTVPFQHLRSNMDALLQTEHSPQKPDGFYFSEFNYIQDFIYQRFIEREEYINKLNQLGNKAMQVVHDIKSPATAMLMYTKDSANIPEQERLALRQAAERVYDIANSLQDIDQQKRSAGYVFPALSIAALVAEKQKEFAHTQIKIHYTVENKAHFAFSNTDDSQLKRVVSNLINNAIEAIRRQYDPSDGWVAIKLQANNDTISIVIQDNGIGLTSQQTQQLNEYQSIHSTKKEGMGLGTQYTLDFIDKYQAYLYYHSEYGVGTQATLTLTREPCPIWLAYQITFDGDALIIIADDDHTIHQAWEQKIKQSVPDSKQIAIKHFHSCHSCLEFINTLTPQTKNKAILLADYEFLKESSNGLKLIEQAQITPSFLVTSYYSDETILKQAVLLNAKVIPKLLTANIELSFSHGQLPNGSAFGRHPEGKNCIVLLDNETVLGNSLQWLAQQKSCELKVFKDPYQLWQHLHELPYDTIICLDYDLNTVVNGIDIAHRLYALGYKKLYLVSGYHFKQNDIPGILTIIKDKTAIFNLINKGEYD